VANEVWTTLPFTEAVLVNPSIRLTKGAAYPFVEMAAVDPNTRSVHESEIREFKGNGARFMPGDALMARITPCLENGKIARFQPTNGTSAGFGSTEFIVIRGRDGITDNDFAYYLTKWSEFRQFAILQMTGSSGRQHVPVSSLAHFEVTIPPISVQRRIAHILGTLDDKIELNRRMNQTLEAIARAIFKSWFVDFDPVIDNALAAGKPIPDEFADRAARRAQLPHEGSSLPENIRRLFPDEFQDSELGPIPKGWETGLVKDLATVSSGKRPNVRYPRPSASAHVPVWGGNGPMAFVPEALTNSPILLTGRVGTLGSVFRITTPCWPSDSTLILSPKSATAFEYLFFQLQQVDFTSLNRGSTQPLLTQTDLKAQPLLSPPEKAIRQFHAFAGTLYTCIDRLENESNIITALRNTLLPKLISGKIRVKDAEWSLRGGRA